jgi:hypothetical protein
MVVGRFRGVRAILSSSVAGSTGVIIVVGLGLSKANLHSTIRFADLLRRAGPKSIISFSFDDRLVSVATSARNSLLFSLDSPTHPVPGPP